ncbi:MAG: FAD-dependent oxidoreductase, partial [Acidimicrobiales bacterium]
MGRSGDRVAVVGGGISGVLSAALLARQGHEVTIIDREPVLGGLLGSVRHGAHWFD